MVISGRRRMKKVKKIVFIYEDNTRHEIRDKKAALLFQARVNTSGILSGLENSILPPKRWWQRENQLEKQVTQELQVCPRPTRSGRLNDLVEYVVKWREKKGFITGWSNMPEKLMLAVTELAEAMEAYRKDDKKNFSEEIADTFIRMLDISGSIGIDVEDEIHKKMEINKKREYKHGKTC